MYVEVTIEEALEICKGNKNSKVLVAISNMEDSDEIVEFVKKTKAECIDIINRANTFAHVCDDWLELLECYSNKQDLKKIEPKGKMTTILFHSRE